MGMSACRWWLVRLVLVQCAETFLLCQTRPAPLPQAVVADGSRILNYTRPHAASVKRPISTYSPLLDVLVRRLHPFSHSETSDLRNAPSDLRNYTPIVKREQKLVPSLAGPGKPEERKNEPATELWPAPAR